MKNGTAMMGGELQGIGRTFLTWGFEAVDSRTGRHQRLHKNAESYTESP